MNLKEGVNLTGIKPELTVGLMVMNAVYTTFGYEMTITSVNDSQHSIKSLHWSGNAADLRIRNLTQEDTSAIYHDGVKALGEHFDLVWEKDHFHLEYQPKF